jgi:UDP-N-acetylmuramoyl-L-alanyl-D-glutamate--2,6-diaminopimelate ligase
VDIKRLDIFKALAAQGAMIERLSADSRRCAPGVAFVACPGESADGRAYIPDAIRRRAAAVLWESEGFSWRDEWQIPNAGIRGLRRAAGELAHEFYGRPSAEMWVCGVTGTNGKTSCSQWVSALLEMRGVHAGIVGTLGCGFPGALEPGFAGSPANTTPGAVELHGILSAMKREGARAVAMEVSSHALVQDRVNGVAFDCALFTNLSHDHLDYHGTMEAYAEAKARLFNAPGLGAAVLNLDDFMGVRLAQALGARGVRTIGYSLSTDAVVPGSVTEFIAAREIAVGREAISMRLASSWGESDALVNQVARFNASNALGVLGCLVAFGIPYAGAASMLAALPAVPGRMQTLGGGDGPLVVVDYAHTPDALDKVLQALRPTADARGGALVALFGAGGDRDPSKRPAMGAIASHLADRIILTSDNPRSEDPLAIIAAIQAGVAVPCEVEPERARAIERAVRTASPGDVVLIAGKGHEDYQEIAGRRLPFSDMKAARAALALRGPK